MTMKTYWDYTEKEQAEMTEETVKSLIDIELMTAGVKKPKPPQLKEIQKSPLGPKVKYFTVECIGRYGSREHTNICFATIEQASAFLQLNPLLMDYDYEVGSEHKYAVPLKDAAVATVDLFDVNQINEFRPVLKQRYATAEANEKESNRFAAETKKSEEVTSKIWTDWFSKINRKRELASIVSTYQEYLGMTKDGALAMQFLKKAHNVPDINEAHEWFSELPHSEHFVPVAAAEVAA